jgi:thiol-disulfide isomerase/thioredoxin
MIKRIRFPLIAVVLLAAALGAGWGIGQWRKSGARTLASSPVTTDRGPLVYQMYCASCHGPDGHGDGSAATALKPPPRDFAARPWRFEPTPDSIRRTTLEGIPGTAMASFRAALSPSDLEAVVGYVHRLATAGPAIVKQLTESEQLLANAGFTNLSGSTPPPLTLSDDQNRTVRLSDFAGQLVLLHFWGTGCTHCIKEIPALTELERRFPGRLKVLHICTDEEDPAVAQKLLDRFVSGTRALVEANGLGLARYEVQSLPTVWLIGPDGKAIGRSTGAKDWSAPAPSKIIEHWLPKPKPS